MCMPGEVDQFVKETRARWKRDFSVPFPVWPHQILGQQGVRSRLKYTLFILVEFDKQLRGGSPLVSASARKA